MRIEDGRERRAVKKRGPPASSNDKRSAKRIRDRRYGAAREAEVASSKVKVVVSSAPVSLLHLTGYMPGVRMDIPVRFSVDGQSEHVILDTGCEVSCVSRKYLQEVADGIDVKLLPRPQFANGVTGAGVDEHYCKLVLYVPVSLSDGTDRLAEITHEVVVSETDTPRMLIGLDVMEAQGFVLDLEAYTAVLRRCGNAVVKLRRHDSSFSQEPLTREARARLSATYEEIARRTHDKFV